MIECMVIGVFTYCGVTTYFTPQSNNLPSAYMADQMSRARSGTRYYSPQEIRKIERELYGDAPSTPQSRCHARGLYWPC